MLDEETEAGEDAGLEADAEDGIGVKDAIKSGVGAELDRRERESGDLDDGAEFEGWRPTKMPS